jgi:hypothetical protein
MKSCSPNFLNYCKVKIYLLKLLHSVHPATIQNCALLLKKSGGANLVSKVQFTIKELLENFRKLIIYTWRHIFRFCCSLVEFEVWYSNTKPFYILHFH